MFVIWERNWEEFVFCSWCALQLTTQGFLQVLPDRGKIADLVYHCHDSLRWFSQIKFREVIKILVHIIVKLGRYHQVNCGLLTSG